MQVMNIKANSRDLVICPFGGGGGELLTGGRGGVGGMNTPDALELINVGSYGCFSISDSGDRRPLVPEYLHSER